MEKVIKKSNRGLTFSFDQTDSFNIGTKVSYTIDKANNSILILPAEQGITVSRKKVGQKVKPLLDLRSKEVKEFVQQADYLQIEIQDNKILVHTYEKTAVKKKASLKQNRVIKLEEIIPVRKTSSILLDKNILAMAAGNENLSEAIDVALSESSLYENEAVSSVSEKVKQDLPLVYDTLSLFSGAGMLDYPFATDEQFKLVFAIDSDKAAVESYKHNIGEHVVCGSVSDLKGRSLPGAKVLIGGAPCKPFTNVNRIKRLQDHEDSKLIAEYIRLVKETGVDVFVLENVPQVLTTCDGKYYQMILDELSGYEVTASLITDCEVGGYTNRKRAIICGSKIGKITLPNIVLKSFKTVDQSLSKVSDKWFNYKDVTIPRADTQKRMSYVPQGGNWKDIPEQYRTAACTGAKKHSHCYHRLKMDETACAIVNWRKPPLIHPTENRTLSVAEASALSGFGEDFRFYGTLNEKQQQCGNGVPYAIGKFVKNAVKKCLNAFYLNREASLIKA